MILKKELDATKRKANELLKFIESEEQKYQKIVQSSLLIERALTEAEQELNQITAGYVNPHMEQIEILNYEIGRNNRQQYELESSLRMISELDGLTQILLDKESFIANLRENIKKLSESNDTKESVLSKVSKIFTEILEAFEYPKLSALYIDDKKYLPYVRGQKYDDLGSLAGVSLITMAYYLAILDEGSGDAYHHLNLLLIDSPRKNLGAQAQREAEDEFKDEKIFHNVIKWLVKFGEENKDRIQLIIVNNGYPDFLPKETIVAEFDADGHHGLPRGLIDDAD